MSIGGTNYNLGAVVGLELTRRGFDVRRHPLSYLQGLEANKRVQKTARRRLETRSKLSRAVRRTMAASLTKAGREHPTERFAVCAKAVRKVLDATSLIAPTLSVTAWAPDLRAPTRRKQPALQPFSSLRTSMCVERIVSKHTMDKFRPESFLPLTPVAFEILLALADGERHGYSILQEVETRSGGAVVAACRHAVSRAGAAAGKRSHRRAARVARSGSDDERRRYYRLTPRGIAVARAEVATARGTTVRGRALARLLKGVRA